MFYPRELLPQIEAELKTDKVIVLTGMRRVGKTTLLNYLFDQANSTNKAKFDLENPLHRKLFEEVDYDNIWNNLQQFGITRKEKAYLFLDEIQNLPEISSVAKYLYDHWQTKFFLTGSSSFYLKNLFPESLAGRKLIYELFPLTFQEFLVFKEVDRPMPASLSFSQKAKNKNKIAHERYRKLYEEFMRFGGFPEVILENNPDRKKQLLEEVFQSYFEKDVKSLADFRGIAKLRDLILLLIPRVGSKIDISKLASSLSTSRETIYSFLEFLEQTYFVKMLPRYTSITQVWLSIYPSNQLFRPFGLQTWVRWVYSKSIDKQAAGSKKLFLCDTGLTQVLGQISSGQSLENSVFQSLRPWFKLSYYQRNSQEIDFILEHKIALEVKETPSQRDLQKLLARSNKLNLKERYLVSLTFSQLPEVILAIDLWVYPLYIHPRGDIALHLGFTR